MVLYSKKTGASNDTVVTKALGAFDCCSRLRPLATPRDLRSLATRGSLRASAASALQCLCRWGVAESASPFQFAGRVVFRPPENLRFSQAARGVVWLVAVEKLAVDFTYSNCSNRDALSSVANRYPSSTWRASIRAVSSSGSEISPHWIAA